MRHVLLMVALTAGCSGELGSPGERDAMPPPPDLRIGAGGPDSSLPSDPTYTNLKLRVFQSCTGADCHTRLTTPMRLDDLTTLLNVAADANAMKVRVKPYDPDNSFLYQKVTAMIGNGEGDPMPPLGMSLSGDDIQVIRDWINTGAPNN